MSNAHACMFGLTIVTEKLYLKMSCCVTVDGGWSEWSEWSECDVTCGWGNIQRTRTCTNPEPECYGEPCVGKDIDKGMCDPACCKGKFILLNP